MTQVACAEIYASTTHFAQSPPNADAENVIERVDEWSNKLSGCHLSVGAINSLRTETHKILRICAGLPG